MPTGYIPPPSSALSAYGPIRPSINGSSMPTIPSIISGSLPHSAGPHPVGYLTITHAPLPGQGFVLDSPTIDTTLPANARTYGAHTSPNGWTAGHVPALGLRRVEYSVWYPCHVTKGWFGRDASPEGVGWLPRYVPSILFVTDACSRGVVPWQTCWRATRDS